MKKYFLLIFLSFFKVQAGFKDVLKSSSKEASSSSAETEKKEESSLASASSAPPPAATPSASLPITSSSPKSSSLKQFKKAPQHDVNAPFGYSGDDFESEIIDDIYVVTIFGNAMLSQDNLVLKSSIIKIYIDKSGNLLKALAQKDVHIHKTYKDKEMNPMTARAQKIEYNNTTGILFLEENVFLEWGCTWESQTLQVNLIQGNVQNIKGSGGFRSFCPQGGP